MSIKVSNRGGIEKEKSFSFFLFFWIFLLTPVRYIFFAIFSNFWIKWYKNFWTKGNFPYYNIGFFEKRMGSTERFFFQIYVIIFFLEILVTGVVTGVENVLHFCVVGQKTFCAATNRGRDAIRTILPDFLGHFCDKNFRLAYA